MSKTGFSQPMFSIYNFSNGVVSHTGGGNVGYGVSSNPQINATADNNLYGDNQIVASDRKFISGTLTLGTTGLSQVVSAAMLGAKLQNLPANIPGITDANVKELIYDDDMNTPYLSYGEIYEEHVDNIDPELRKSFYRAVVFPKVMFNIPSDQVQTRAGEIVWQTSEITGTIMRDDTAKHEWKRESEFSTEEQAAAYIRYMLGITTATPENGDEEGGT